MNAPSKPLAAKDFKSDLKPIWCPGCGDYAVLNAVTKALAELEFSLEEVAVVSGIGCSSRIPAYLKTYGFHGIHGRALPAATGVKLANPDLQVLVTGGDGDGLSIGGNHFLHACRRNVDLTYVIMDNRVYGMTKGQASPTSEADWDNKLSPGGTGLTPFNPVNLALMAGANFVARGWSGNPNHVVKLIVEGMSHPGFSFIHVLSPCPTFRPEHTPLWKQEVARENWEATSDFREAQQRLLDDSGLNTGVLYQGDRPAYMDEPRRVTTTVKEIEAAFAI